MVLRGIAGLMLLRRVSLLGIILRICHIRIVLVVSRRRVRCIMLGIVLLGVLLSLLVLRVRIRWGRGGNGLGRRLARIIRCHLLVEPLLIVIRLILVHLLFLGGKRPPAFAHQVSHFREFHVGEFDHDLGALVEGEEHVGSAGTFGRIGVLVFLVILAPGTRHGDRIHQLSPRIESRRRDVIGHLAFEPLLVLEGGIFPPSFFLRSERLVHGRGEFGQLAEGHSRVFGAE
mmetsp:Transcript_35237/g.85001  ORF Transcript_35237/g.85001 Transcript_35237/m.85001 type:complete len:230 (+) Transcript_35237:158-847(+)